MKRPFVFIPIGPPHFILTTGRLVEIAGIPVAWQASSKIPTAVDALVMIPIEHLHNHPFAATLLRGGLMLVFTVDNAYRSIGVFKFDNVIANVMRGARKLNPQSFIHPLLKMCAANLVSTDPM